MASQAAIVKKRAETDAALMAAARKLQKGSGIHMAPHETGVKQPELRDVYNNARIAAFIEAVAAAWPAASDDDTGGEPEPTPEPEPEPTPEPEPGDGNGEAGGDTGV